MKSRIVMVHPEKEIVHVCELYRHNVFKVYDLVSESYLNIMFTSMQLRCDPNNPFNTTYHNLTYHKVPFYSPQLKHQCFTVQLYQNELPGYVSTNTSDVYYRMKPLSETSKLKLMEMKPEYFI
ncbi:hypothetical protein WCWAEYFT_CDS0281 [Vibrio phage VB_VaC_TDDLMA]